MAAKLAQIAEVIGAEVSGDGERQVVRMAPLDAADAESLCFARTADQVDAVAASGAAGCVVDAGFPPVEGTTLLRVEDAQTGFIRALEFFVPAPAPAGIDEYAVIAVTAQIDPTATVGPCAVVADGARIGAHSRIGAGCYVGAGSSVGEDCLLHPNVSLLDGVRVGDRCVLHAGVVVGADGYGFHWTGDHHHKVPQLGSVCIEDDVEIGANSCIDRATLGETRIGRGTKIDNLVQVAHNNVIGRHVLLVAQVGLAGSCRVGDGVIFAGQAACKDHTEIGAGAQIGPQAGIIGDLEPGARVLGSPARPVKHMLREQAALGKLPELLKTVKAQQQAIEALKERIAQLEDE